MVKKKQQKFRLQAKGSIQELTAKDIRAMPDGHIACGKCNRPWFLLCRFPKPNDKMFLTECESCGADSTLNIDTLKEELTVNGGLPDEGGDLHCPKCRSKRFAIQKQRDFACIGCKSCATQWIFNLSETDGGIVLCQ